MKFFYTDSFVLPLPEGHRFPMRKYSRLRERVEGELLETGDSLEVPLAATDKQLSLAHTAEYVAKATQGRLDKHEIRRLGFPWTPELIERSRRSVGGTIAASRAALADGFAANLAGGTHHAFSDASEGYCVFNDAAVAASVLIREGSVHRVIVIDCDVHQGNGTASICAGRDDIFTFSIHGAKNFPLRKEVSDLDVALPDGTTDEEYLRALQDHLPRALHDARAELAIYLAGADPFEGDRLGRFALTKEGLAQRDEYVLGECRRGQLPVAIAMAGGYALNVEDIVDIHFNTLKIAKRMAEKPLSPP